MRRSITTVAGAFALLMSTAASAPAAETIKLRIGAGHPAGATWIITIRELFMPQFAERVKAETKYEIQWTEAWGGSVCKLGECLEAVESGLLDMADLQTPFEPAKLMAWNFSYFVPFGASDPRIGAELNHRTYQEVPQLKKMLEDRYNQVFVGVGIIGNYGLITNFQWDNVDQLKGQKIAAAGPNIPWIQAAGMVAVQSNLNEAYTSMQTGVYNGWVMFPDGATSFRLEEVSKQHTITGFGVIGTPLLTINRDTWNDLPPEVQKIMLEVGADWNKRAGEFTAKRQEQAVEKMKSAEVRIKQLTAEERTAWAAKLPNIPKQRFDEIKKAGQPAEAVYQYIKLLKQKGHQFPRDWEAER